MLLELPLAPTPSKRDIRKTSPDDLKAFMVEHGEKPFRAKQVLEWLWKNSASSFEEMNNLSLATRELLAAHFVINGVTVQNHQRSNDGTIKSAFKLYDGNIVEGVLIPHDTRMTACISSQVGCSLTCKFCATGYMDRKRNLDAGRDLRPSGAHSRAVRKPVRHAAHQHRVHGHGRAPAQLRQRGRKRAPHHRARGLEHGAAPHHHQHGRHRQDD
jgi:hypothetical protein